MSRHPAAVVTGRVTKVTLLVLSELRCVASALNWASPKSLSTVSDPVTADIKAASWIGLVRVPFESTFFRSCDRKYCWPGCG